MTNNVYLYEMIEETTKFLSNIGIYPAYKKVEKETIEAENKLSNRLNDLFTLAEHRIIKEIEKTKYIPTSKNEQIDFLRKFMSFLFNGEINEILLAAALSALETGRLLAFLDMQRNGMNFSYRQFDTWTRDYLRDKYYKFSQYTTERLIGNVAESLSKSYEKGLGIDEAAEELRKEFEGLRTWQLQRIARTEINGAQNEGSYETYKEHDIYYKQWISTQDSRTRGNRPSDRANHVIMHGEVAGMIERFSNGLLFPGDRTSGNLAEFINCRCRIRMWLPRPGQAIPQTPFKP